MVYQYKSHANIKAPAQLAGEMCERLAQTGGLTPKRLVEANRDENAPLHGEFEWDDSIAAEAYRETQAAYIIRCIVVKPEVTTCDEEPTRAFVRVTDTSWDYTPIKVVMKNPDMMERLMEEAKKDMNRFVNKYRSLENLQDVIDSMEKALGEAS